MKLKKEIGERKLFS